jgi:hypothetical protein
MSWTGQCPRCGDAALLENVRGLKEHEGPAFQRWRRACVAAFGAILPDDLAADDDPLDSAA